MKEAHRAGVWQLPKSASFLRHYPCFAAMLNKLWSLIWYAHIGSSLLDPRFSVRYIGRYTKRAVLAEYRITYYDGRRSALLVQNLALRAIGVMGGWGVGSAVLTMTPLPHYPKSRDHCFTTRYSPATNVAVPRRKITLKAVEPTTWP
jgi:hypothetical protein